MNNSTGSTESGTATASFSTFRSLMSLGPLFGLVALALFVSSGRSAVTQTHSKKTTTKPTIVLIHGAWANTASWSGEISRLQADGYTVAAPPNPLLSVSGDSQFIADYLKTRKVSRRSDSMRPKPRD